MLFVLSARPQTGGHSVENGHSYVCSKRKQTFPASAAINCKYLLGSRGTWYPSPLSKLGFGLAWVCTHLVQDVTTTVHSSLQLPCCDRKTLFTCHLPPRSLLALCPQRSIGVGKKTFPLGLSIRESLTLWTLARCGLLCYSQIETSIKRTEQCSRPWVEVIRNWFHILSSSRIIVIN